MKVAILGLWHLGTVTAACVAGAGVPTVGIDDDPGVITKLGNGEPPLYEPGLAELVGEGIASGRLSTPTISSAVRSCPPPAATRDARVRQTPT